MAIVEKNLEIFLWPPLLQSNPDVPYLHLNLHCTLLILSRVSPQRDVIVTQCSRSSPASVCFRCELLYLHLHHRWQLAISMQLYFIVSKTEDSRLDSPLEKSHSIFPVSSPIGLAEAHTTQPPLIPKHTQFEGTSAYEPSQPLSPPQRSTLWTERFTGARRGAKTSRISIRVL